MLETIREPGRPLPGSSLKLTDLSVQDNLEYTAAWNQVMLQSDVRLPHVGSLARWMDELADAVADRTRCRPWEHLLRSKCPCSEPCQSFDVVGSRKT